MDALFLCSSITPLSVQAVVEPYIFGNSIQLASVLKDMPLISLIINVNRFVEMVCS